MNIKATALGLALAATLGTAANAADLVNGGFETGDLTGWGGNIDFISVVPTTDDATAVTYSPYEGDYFARLTAGEAGTYITLTQSFHLDGLGQLFGAAAFLSFDYLGDDGNGNVLYNDDAYVRVFDSVTSQVLFSSSVADLGGAFGSTPWTTFKLDLGAGDYTFEAGVRNADVADYSSQLLVDGVKLTTQTVGGVPEPASWALMIGGFGAAGMMLRKRRALGI